MSQTHVHICYFLNALENCIEYGRMRERTRKKCPCCRVLLIQILFTKPYNVNMSSHSKTSLFVWVPIVVYLKKDYENDLVLVLPNNDLAEAFKCAFMLKSPPTDAQSIICAEWKDYYNTRIATFRCCSCQASFLNDQLFMSSCGHFCVPFAHPSFKISQETHQ